MIAISRLAGRALFGQAIRQGLRGHGQTPSLPRLSVTIRGTKKLLRDIEKFKALNRKALTTAIRVQGFQLRKQLQGEIRAGAPGGRRFENLTYLARRRRGRNSWLPDKPMGRLAGFVRYDVVSQSPFAVAVGWTDKTPMRLRMIAKRQQKGFTSSVSERRESYFRHRGGEVSKRSDRRKYFFLRKTTTSFETPARPVIDPFWAEHKAKAMAEIRRNFRLKAAGRRI